MILRMTTNLQLYGSLYENFHLIKHVGKIVNACVPTSLIVNHLLIKSLKFHQSNLRF